MVKTLGEDQVEEWVVEFNGGKESIDGVPWSGCP